MEFPEIPILPITSSIEPKIHDNHHQKNLHPMFHLYNLCGFGVQLENGYGREQSRYMARSEGRERTEYKRHIDWIIHLQTKGYIRNRMPCFPLESTHRSCFFSFQWQRKPRAERIEPWRNRANEYEMRWKWSYFCLFCTENVRDSILMSLSTTGNDIRQTLHKRPQKRMIEGKGWNVRESSHIPNDKLPKGKGESVQSEEKTKSTNVCLTKERHTRDWDGAGGNIDIEWTGCQQENKKKKMRRWKLSRCWTHQ